MKDLAVVTAQLFRGAGPAPAFSLAAGFGAKALAILVIAQQATGGFNETGGTTIAAVRFVETTIDAVADDVADARLAISREDVVRDANSVDVAFINSKGFGGNNATGVVLADHVVEAMLSKRYGAETLSAWQAKREVTREAAKAYDEQALHGNFDVIYNFGQNMINESDIAVDSDEIRLPGFENPISLTPTTDYSDML